VIEPTAHGDDPRRRPQCPNYAGSVTLGSGFDGRQVLTVASAPECPLWSGFC